MEIAKFVLTAIGTFISVSGLTFTVFQFWAKRRDEKDKAFKDSVVAGIESGRKISAAEIQQKRAERKEATTRLSKKMEQLEASVLQNLQNRIGVIEGELKGIRAILQSIQDWFINNTPSGSR